MSAETRDGGEVLRWFANINDKGHILAVFRGKFYAGTLRQQEVWSTVSQAWKPTDAILYSIWMGDNGVEEVDESLVLRFIAPRDSTRRQD
jgi:hypothetical protein